MRLFVGTAKLSKGSRLKEPLRLSDINDKLKNGQFLFHMMLTEQTRHTCSFLSVLSASLSLFLPLSPAEPSGPARELSTGDFIPAVICASISSKLLQSREECAQEEFDKKNWT